MVEGWKEGKIDEVINGWVDRGQMDGWKDGGTPSSVLRKTVL